MEKVSWLVGVWPLCFLVGWCVASHSLRNSLLEFFLSFVFVHSLIYIVFCRPQFTVVCLTYFFVSTVDLS